MTKNKTGGILHRVFACGILLVCGFVLTSVDDCESGYLMEQEQNTRLAKAEQERAAQLERERALRAEREQAARTEGQSGRQAAGATEGSGSAENRGGGSSGQGASSGTSASSGTAARSGSPAAGSGAAVTGSGAAAESGDISALRGKNWKLSELRFSNRIVVIDRNKLNADGMGDLFTLTVDDGRVSGKAAPNRYTAPYQAGANNSLTINPPAGTLMASVYDPERLREQEYFQYLIRVKSWKINQGRLELYTTDANNREAVLVYVN
ncbi:MAG: META domain-containing protein [Spirochaetaceae bacterium]|nr:META domain-containing protein [Spirochaetaceae bacterium]